MTVSEYLPFPPLRVVPLTFLVDVSIRFTGIPEVGALSSVTVPYSLLASLTALSIRTSASARDKSRSGLKVESG
ncbi:hypothetical protein D3C80_2130000 [compost metagenome]